jgi:hypothetical protein
VQRASARACASLTPLRSPVRHAGALRPFRKTILKLAKRLTHRGPDWFSLYAEDDRAGATTNYMAHLRLAIVSPDTGDNNIAPGCSSSGDQPLFNQVRACARAAPGVARRKSRALAARMRNALLRACCPR